MRGKEQECMVPVLFFFASVIPPVFSELQLCFCGMRTPAPVHLYPCVSVCL